MVLSLIILALFAEFFAPVDPTDANLQDSFIPPTRIRLVDAEGNFHLRPFVYKLAVTINPNTFEPLWEEDPSQRYQIQFFVRSWEWEILGLIPTRWHLFGVGEGGKIHLLGTEKQGRDLWGRACTTGRISLSLSLFATIVSIVVGAVVGIVSGYYGGITDDIIQRFVEFVASFPQLPLWLALAAIIPRTWDSLQVFIIIVIIFSLLSWTLLAREVRGKVLAYRETDFILAAKEMGASDARIAVMYVGRLVEIAESAKLLRRPLHPYTEALVSAIPPADPEIKLNRIILDGDIPSPANPPPGCVFHPRCLYAQDLCAQGEPQLEEIEPGHLASCHFAREITLQGIGEAE